MAQYQNSNVSLSFRERLHYGIGTIGYNASFYWVSAFLQIYYTDTIGVSAGALSALVLAVRMFDAINDPIIGSMADRTKSRWGRYRPWLLFGGIGAVAEYDRAVQCAVLLESGHQSLMDVHLVCCGNRNVHLLRYAVQRLAWRPLLQFS